MARGTEAQKQPRRDRDHIHMKKNKEIKATNNGLEKALNSVSEGDAHSTGQYLLMASNTKVLCKQKQYRITTKFDLKLPNFNLL